MPIGCERVQEGIGSGIVCLALLADEPGDAGEHGEKVKRRIVFQGNIVDVPRAGYLGADNGVKIFYCHGCEDLVLGS